MNLCNTEKQKQISMLEDPKMLLKTEVVYSNSWKNQQILCNYNARRLYTNPQ